MTDDFAANKHAKHSYGEREFVAQFENAYQNTSDAGSQLVGHSTTHAGDKTHTVSLPLLHSDPS